MNLDTNAHSVFSLHYHLILVTKYRKSVFNDEISNRARALFEVIAPSYKIEVLEWNHDQEHVHIFFKAQPKTELSKFINAYKSASSRVLKKEFPSMREQLWQDMFWSRSFCLLSSGSAPIEVIQQYIKEQGSNDGKTKSL